MSESSDDCIILSSSESESTRKSASTRVHHNIKQEEQAQEQYEYSASPLPASKQIYCCQPNMVHSYFYLIRNLLIFVFLSLRTSLKPRIVSWNLSSHNINILWGM